MQAQPQLHTLWWLWAPALILDGKRHSGAVSVSGQSGLRGRMQDAERLLYFQKISRGG
jgi:hypothetical protein